MTAGWDLDKLRKMYLSSYHWSNSLRVVVESVMPPTFTSGLCTFFKKRIKIFPFIQSVFFALWVSCTAEQISVNFTHFLSSHSWSDLWAQINILTSVACPDLACGSNQSVVHENTWNSQAVICIAKICSWLQTFYCVETIYVFSYLYTWGESEFELHNLGASVFSLLCSWDCTLYAVV